MGGIDLSNPNIYVVFILLVWLVAWFLLPFILMRTNYRLDLLRRETEKTNRLLQNVLQRGEGLPSMRPSRHDLDGG